MRSGSQTGFVAPTPVLSSAQLATNSNHLRCSTFTPFSVGVVPRHFSRPSSPSVRHVRRVTPQACASTNVLSLDELQASVTASLVEARETILQAKTLKALDDLRVKYLGKKGSITVVMKSVGKLAGEDRPKLGAIVNKAKDEVATLIQEHKTVLEAEGSSEDGKAWVDLSMPGIKTQTRPGRLHPLTSTIEIATEIFRDIGYDLIDDAEFNREIETDYFCFEALNCPPDHPAREMQDTFYLTEDKKMLLRTQTSSVQIRYMLQNKPPFKILAPGRVYRRDTVDATHSPVFHQIEILAVDKFGVLNIGSLRATVIHFLKKMLGDDIDTRFRASFFPFTEPSMEVDVFFRGKWLEVLGCGMVDPAVLEGVGLDPKEWCGFAAGFGVERFTMVMHEITDIRELYKNDPRFTRQFMSSIDGVLEEGNKPFPSEGDSDEMWRQEVEWDGAIFYNKDWGVGDKDGADEVEGDGRLVGEIEAP